MRTYEFEVFVRWEADAGVEFLEKAETPLFEAFQGDVSPAVRAGRPYVSAIMQAESLEAAIRRVADVLRAAGLEVGRLQMDEEEVAALLA